MCRRLEPIICVAACEEVLGGFYLAEAVFTKLTRVDKDKGLAANFRMDMESCKSYYLKKLYNNKPWKGSNKL